MPPENRDHATCIHHEALAQTATAIKGDTAQILKKIGHFDTAIATMDRRLSMVEKVVYGAVKIILVAVLTAIVALVIIGKDGKANNGELRPLPASPSAP